VTSELIVTILVEVADSGFLDGTGHPFDLSVGPRMIHLGGPMLDAVLPAGAPEDVLHGGAILFAVFELDAAQQRAEIIPARLWLAEIALALQQREIERRQWSPPSWRANPWPRTRRTARF